jgi:hypothetical protein
MSINAPAMARLRQPSREHADRLYIDHFYKKSYFSWLHIFLIKKIMQYIIINVLLDISELLAWMSKEYIINRGAHITDAIYYQKYYLQYMLFEVYPVKKQESRVGSPTLPSCHIHLKPETNITTRSRSG